MRSSIRLVLIALLAGLVLMPALSTPAFADVEVNWGEGEYRRYHEQLADLAGREADIERELADLIIYKTYCIGGNPTLAEHTQALRDLRRRYNALRDEYRAFKRALSDLASGSPGLLTGFEQENMTPENPNFWTGADRFMGGAEPILQQKDAQLVKAKEVDCSKADEPEATLVTPPPPPPPPARTWPPVRQTDPLANLHRPPTALPALPAPHGRFCSQAEKDAYLKMIIALREKVFSILQPAGQYRSDLSSKAVQLSNRSHELSYAVKAGTANPNEYQELQRQRAAVEAEIAAFEPIYKEIAALWNAVIALENAALNAPVEDCRPPGETGGTGIGVTPPVTRPGDDPLRPDPVERRQPHVPVEFCSEEERDKWIRDNLNPLDDKAADQTEAWQSYVDELKKMAGMTGTRVYHDHVARLLAEAEENLAKAKQYEETIKRLYEEARAAKIKNCGGSRPSINIGIGIGIGGGGHRDDRDRHGDRDRNRDGDRGREGRGPADQFHGEEGRPPGGNQVDGEDFGTKPRGD